MQMLNPLALATILGLGIILVMTLFYGELELLQNKH